MDERTKTVELGQVSLSRGLDLLEERLAFGGVFFESGEEAMAKTMIGFHRDEEDYIEFDIVDENLTTVRAGVGVTEKGEEQQADLGDYDSVRAMVRAYFNQPRDFHDYWIRIEGRKRFP